MIVHNSIEKRIWEAGQVTTRSSKTLVGGKYVVVTTSTPSTIKSTDTNYRKNFQDSISTPNFRERVSKGIPMPYNPYNRELREYGPWTGWRRNATYKVSQGQDGYIESYSAGDFVINVTNLPKAAAFDRFPFTQADIDSLTKLVDAKLLSKIKDQKVNAANAMAEAYKTMDMVSDNAIRIANALRNLRRGNIAGAADALGVKPRKRSKARFQRTWPRDQNRATARGWLELQYGWKPLLDDIYGGCEHLAQNPPPSSISVHTHKALEYHDAETLAENQLYNTIVKRETAQLIVRKGVRFKIHDLQSKTMAQLGFSNPAVVAWEILPFSFVIDWTLPIGNWLASFDATVGLTFLDSYRTVFRKWHGTNTYHRFGRDSVYEYSGDMVQRYNGMKEVRTKLTSFPSPTFPSFRNPLSPLRLANALALLQSMRK